MRTIRKAVAGGLTAAAAAAGIVIADLDWPAIIGAFVVGLVGVFVAPANALTAKQKREIESRSGRL